MSKSCDDRSALSELLVLPTLPAKMERTGKRGKAWVLTNEENLEQLAEKERQKQEQEELKQQRREERDRKKRERERLKQERLEKKLQKNRQLPSSKRRKTKLQKQVDSVWKRWYLALENRHTQSSLRVQHLLSTVAGDRGKGMWSQSLRVQH